MYPVNEYLIRNSKASPSSYITLSSNYELYGDLSQRVMEILAQFAPEIEIYLIDEAFLNLTGLSLDLDYAQQIKQRVKQWLGLPISIGIAPTKTLAKLANHIAKRSPEGIYSFYECDNFDSILETTPVRDIWGIGKQQEKWLLSKGIDNALKLRDMHIGELRHKMGIIGVKMQMELVGKRCPSPMSRCQKLFTLLLIHSQKQIRSG